MKRLTFPILYLCLPFLVACHKDHGSGPGTSTDTTTTTTSTTPLGAFKINLVSSEADWLDSAKTNIELIISEPGGKVLLDTITPANTTITASLSTTSPTVDLSNIYYNAAQKMYTVTTYKGVNPSSWAGNYNESYYYPSGPRPPLVNDTLEFVNWPADQNIQFSQNPFSGLDANMTFLTNKITTVLTQYPMIPGNYAYLLCGDSGFYKMVIPSGTNQQIDCSQMDTAATASFNPPSSSYYGYFYSQVRGYPDSNNLNSQLALYVNTNAVPGKAQLVYPTKNIQKYAVLGLFIHTGKESTVTYSCGSTVNTNVTYADPSSYTINADQNNDFSVTWNAAKPTYYFTNWTTPTVSWTLYAPPDSAKLNPLALLTAQKSKMLQGQDLTSLALSTFQFETIQGYDYPGYLGLVCDSTRLWKNLVSSSVMYTKSF